MENKFRQVKLSGVALAFFILFLVLFFPFPIEIIDALTLQPVADYSIHISLWRMVFEPFLGPLLFFNRAVDPLGEIPAAILWVLILYCIYRLIQLKSLPSKFLKRKEILGMFGNLPILVGIGFAFFLIILFIPLPSNTIVNNSENDILVTTHSHTEYSHDGLTTQMNMWKWHKRNGFDAFFITDHANYNKTLEFSQQQRDNKFPLKPLVMVGQEHSGSNHMSLLGLDGSFQTQGQPDSSIVKLTHKNGGAVIINHWFDGKGKEKEFYKALGVDGFEIENVGKELYYKRTLFQELKQYCEDNGLIMVGGLDYHGYGRKCAIWNALAIPNWHNMDIASKESSILKILRDRDQSKLRVLMYRDRPLYEEMPLLIGPPVTVINYFRTLKGYQVASWIIWWAIFQMVLKFRIGRDMASNNALPIWGAISALFMLLLGLFYFTRGLAIEGHTKLYGEYSTLLFIIGGAFILYSATMIYRRFFRKAEN
ncbi:PHP domain-containing protein [Arenibacter latericius]|uniref:PHP domain-containing protein n=1 Tax=Arenibacter latericius TaxID=86104 RepID=UPI00040F1884|nr:PHP domain-containing protein [Arenibacter latericius]